MMSMRTTALVTSDHKKGRDAVAKFRVAYDEAQLTPEAAQRLNEAKGWKGYISAGILHFSSNKHPAAEEIERFYAEVLGMTIDLTGILFPEKQGFPVYMAVTLELNEDMVMQKTTKYFGVKACAWRSPIAGNIDHKSVQKRPEGIYVFAHRGGDEPDAEHLGKSYDDAVAEKMTFLNPLEFLLCTGFHMWKHKKWMDRKGWTRTSSLWSDGRLVGGVFDLGSSGLCLCDGYRDCRDADDGPRELFLG